MSASSILDDVSRETRERLEIFVAEIRAWQKAVNLVSRNSLPEIWTRHIADCLQLVALAPEAATWLDLGSGAGLPGLVIAATDRLPTVTLVDSDARKCAFLRHAARAMRVEAPVIEGRIETASGALARVPDVVTARGLAPLRELIAYAEPALEKGAVGLFLKGNNAASELTLAREYWNFEAETIPSRSDSTGNVLRITAFGGRRA